MGKSKFTFKLEMASGQMLREVSADSYSTDAPWLIFHRRPPTGGSQEYWRVNLAHVVSMETARNG